MKTAKTRVRNGKTVGATSRSKPSQTDADLLSANSALAELFEIKIRGGEKVVVPKNTAIQRKLLDLRGGEGWQIKVGLDVLRTGALLEYAAENNALKRTEEIMGTLDKRIHSDACGKIEERRKEEHQRNSPLPHVKRSPLTPLETVKLAADILSLKETPQTSRSQGSVPESDVLQLLRTSLDLLKIKNSREQMQRVGWHPIESLLSPEEWKCLLFGKKDESVNFEAAKEKLLRGFKTALGSIKRHDVQGVRRGNPNFLINYTGAENAFIPLPYAQLDQARKIVEETGKLPTKDAVLKKIEDIFGLEIVTAKELQPRPAIEISKATWSENWKKAGLDGLPKAAPHKGVRQR